MKRNFRKLSNVEHVRLRTGMWLGQNSSSTFDQHFFKPLKNLNYKIIHQEIEEVPAKLKCIDEACMNSIDEYNRNLRDRTIPIKQKMKTLEVILTSNQKRITITDDGRGIPAKNAEQVFLHLMYGENFDDKLKKEHIAGQNGVGISLVRIVSSYFKVVTKNNGKCFKKIFTVTEKFRKTISDLGLSVNLGNKIEQYIDEHGSLKMFPNLDSKSIKKINQIAKKELMLGEILPIPQKEHGTSIEFELNPKYFNNLNTNFQPILLEQYLQDLAMTNPGLIIFFKHNKQEKKYFFKKGLEDIFKNNPIPFYKIFYQNPSTNLELETFVLGDSGKNLSWINSNFASLGGSSIEFLMNLICDEIRKKPPIVAYEKKLKTTSTRNDVRNCVHIYNNFHLVAPRFKSQDKSYLINDLREDIRKAIQQHLEKLIRKLDLINKVKEEIRKRTKLREMDDAHRILKKANRSVIAKFIPCTSKDKNVIKTLFIGEGDSAIAGLRQVRNPAIHALFPLRGKPLNVREMSLSKTMQNEEFKNIVSIIGLPFEKEIINIENLEFNRLSIITDADYDGYAIRSLILNFFFEYWPELFQLGFIYMTEAPLYEVELLNKNKKKKLFYCIDDHEFEKLMLKAKKNSCTMIRKKRNKGLGETSSSALTYALEHGLKKITLKQMKQAKIIQNLWFHKNQAAQRRKEISSYKQLFLED